MPDSPERRNLQSFIRTMASGGVRGAGFARAGPVRTLGASWPETLAMAGAAARALRDEKTEPGDRVLIALEDGPAWIGAFLGTLATGAVVVPLDLTSSPAQVRSVASACDARTLLSSGTFGEGFEGRRIDFASLGPGDRRWLEPVADPEPDDLAEIIFTSGTTATPRGVMITHANILTALAGIEAGIVKRRRMLGLFSPITILNLVPLSHMFGQALGLFIPLILGARVVFSGSRPPRALLSLAKREKAWVMVGVPRHLASLRPCIAERVKPPAGKIAGKWYARAIRSRRMLREHGWRLRTLVVGGARLDPELEAFFKGLGYLLVQGYGLTETAPIVSVSNPFDNRVGIVGKPGRAQELKLSDDGEILVRGGNITRGYYGDEAATAEVLPDGWLHTGDLGALEPDGSLRILGRKKEMIVTGEGQNVFPDEVEEVLRRQKHVADCAVLARTGERGEEVHAAVILDEPGAGSEARLEAVVAAANKSLAPHQRIRGWTLWTDLDFPRTPTGKVMRRSIRARVEGTAGAGPDPGSASEPAAPLELLRAMAGTGAGADQKLGSELGLSSIDVAELTASIEERYQIEVDPARMHDDVTLSQLLEQAAEPAGRRPWPMPVWSRSAPARIARSILQALIVFPGLALFTRLTSRGERVFEGRSSPAIIAANHTSHFDVPLLLATIPRAARRRVAVAMQPEYFEPYLKGEGSLAKRLHLGWHYRLVSLLLHTFPFPRSAAFRVAMAYAGEMVDRGYSILVFPEGLLSRDGSMQAFRPGVGVLARELGLPVIPARIEGAFEVMPVGRMIPRRVRGPVRVAWGQPHHLLDGEEAAGFAKRLEETVRGL